ncbi:protein kinase [Candidatus Woesearchaeota archaeon]|nr:protein kinase [Candidatus Woesearchaeota archaeon]
MDKTPNAHEFIETVSAAYALFKGKKYNDARNLINPLVEFIFNPSSEPPIGKNSPGMPAIYRRLADIFSQEGEFGIPQILSNLLLSLDIYASLNEIGAYGRQTPASGTLQNALCAFPGHLSVKKAVFSGKMFYVPYLRSQCFGRYLNPDISSYNSENLDGRLSPDKQTLTDILSLWVPDAATPKTIEFLVEIGGCLDPDMVIAEQRILRALNTPLIIVAGRQAEGHQMKAYRFMLGGLFQERKAHLQHLMGGLKSYEGDRPAKPQAPPKFLGSLFYQWQQKILSFAQLLPPFITELSKEEAAYLERIPDIAFNKPPEEIIECLGHVFLSIKDFANFWQTFPFAEKTQESLYSHFARVQTPLYGSSGDFFNRLKRIITEGTSFRTEPSLQSLREKGRKLWCECLNDAVACAMKDIGGDHRIIAPLGEGAFMSVYIALEKSLIPEIVPEDFCALKIRKGGGEGGMLLDRAQRSEELSDRLSKRLSPHSNIAPLSFHNLDSPTPYFVEPLFDEDLESKVKSSPHGHLSVKEAVRAITQIAEGLGEVHRRGIIHNDIKANNIGVLKGNYLLSDFGLAMIENRDDGFVGAVGNIRGSAPELYGANKVRPNRRTDLYSVGMLLFYIAVGEYPFHPSEILKVRGLTPPTKLIELDKCNIRTMPGEGRTQSEELLAPLKQDMRFFEQTLNLFSQITSDTKLTEILGKLIHPDPGHRYLNIEELKGELKKLAAVPEY